MAPAGRSGQMIPPSDARESGVLLLLYPGESGINTVLILRPEYDGVHGGQVGFPGGKREEKDSDIIATALREANEEVGVREEKVQLLGQLTELYIPPSNIKVSPIVGFTEEPPRFVPDSREVAEIIEADINHFLREEYRGLMDIKTPLGIIRNAPYFALHHYRIWGATAMMLSEFSALLKNT